jgi:hypothetical protein
MAGHEGDFDLARLERVERRLQVLERRGSSLSPSTTSLNGQIYVDGDTARAQWYLFMPCTVADENRAMWRAGVDHERYRRVEGTWLFSEKRSQPLS